MTETSPESGVDRIDDVEYAHIRAIRVAVARDVLVQIQMNTIVPKRGTYIEVAESDELTLPWDTSKDLRRLAVGGSDPALDDRYRNAPPVELQSLLPMLPKCETCALGAAMLSYARIFDNLKVGWDEKARLSAYSIMGVRDLMREKLGYEFAHALEDRFENYGHDATARMMKLMQDVIDEGGVLPLMVETEYESDVRS